MDDIRTTNTQRSIRRSPVLAESGPSRSQRVLGVDGFTEHYDRVWAIPMWRKGAPRPSLCVSPRTWGDPIGIVYPAQLRQSMVRQSGPSQSRDASREYARQESTPSCSDSIQAWRLKSGCQINGRSGYRNPACDGSRDDRNTGCPTIWHRSNQREQDFLTQELETSSVVPSYFSGRQRASYIPCGVLLRTRPPKAINSMERSND